jgi:membrane-bound ClpP family serine protease
MLFKPLLVAGMIIGAIGIICIWIGTSIISPKEEGDGFKIIGIRFLISSMVSIGLSFIAKYFIIIKYILRQVSYKIKPDENKFSGWGRP